jgi:hypothetical protein
MKISLGRSILTTFLDQQHLNSYIVHLIQTDGLDSIIYTGNPFLLKGKQAAVFYEAAHPTVRKYAESWKSVLEQLDSPYVVIQKNK